MGSCSLFALESGCSLPNWASLSSPYELTDCSKSSEVERSMPRLEGSSCILASLDGSIEKLILKQLHKRYSRLLLSFSDLPQSVRDVKAAAGWGRDAPTTAAGTAALQERFQRDNPLAHAMPAVALFARAA